MPTVFIPAQLRELTGGVSQVEMEAATVKQVIAQLEAQFPGVADRLAPNGALAPALVVAVDGSLSSKGLQARVESAREVHFLPAIGGG